MDKDWGIAYSTNKSYLAEIAKELLEENGIQSVVVNKKDSAYLFGDIEVCVKKDNIIRAKYLLKDLEG